MKRAVAPTGPATATMKSSRIQWNGQRDQKRPYSLKPRYRKDAKSLVVCFSFAVALIWVCSSTHLMHKAIHTQNEGVDVGYNPSNGTIPKSKNPTFKVTTKTSHQDGASLNLENGSRISNSKSNLTFNSTKKSLKVDAATASSTSAGFVHMGKTAGSTLSMMLRNGCHSFVRKPCHVVPNETSTSRLVQAYYHVPDFHLLPASNHQIYILSVRDVYERTISSFLYHHPKNFRFYHVILPEQVVRQAPLAYSCFPTLEKFASFLRNGNSTECDYPYRHNEIETEDCEKFACAVIQGRIRHIFVHLFFNYRNIYAKIPATKPEKRLFVIRKEHLWEDWRRVDTMLNLEENEIQPSASGGSFDNVTRRNVTGINLPVSGEISDSGRSRICKALEPEYRTYFRILHRAENMGTRDLEDARKLAEKNCPILDFRSMLVD
mmetsp:Transcript_10629/g.26833  ORF Transcript_10629/g.26833 Transcript_10629/m.26833 type:complete len:434 (+) Transcript_10629:181-1482(+)